MEEDKFRTLCARIDFAVEPALSPEEQAEIDGDRMPLMAMNDNGDTVYYRRALGRDEWILDIDVDGYALDKEGFTIDEVNVRDGVLVIEDVGGVRSRSGVGYAGFDHAEFRLDDSGSTVIEQH